MKRVLKIYLFLFLITFTNVFAQKTFKVEVKVVDQETNLLIKNATVRVNGREFEYAYMKDFYEVTAKVGDQLTVTHPDFNTVFYTIKSNEEIKIVVENFSGKRERLAEDSYSKRKARRPDNYNSYLDSAKFYKKKSIDKSLSFIEKTLHEDLTSKRKASSFSVLADIYLHWKQYDLAVENYMASLKEDTNVATRIQLAKAQYLNKEYKESEKSYKASLSGELSNYQQLIVYEGIGDVYLKTKDYNKVNLNYKKALKIAKENNITPKITDLNSKLAEAYAQEGKNVQADKMFKNSLELANKENVKRSLKEEYKVAEFYNKSRRYDEEIKLRKQSLKNSVGLVRSAKDSLSDSITSQKLNYKIGNAYFENEEFDEAITYLEKSIDDATEKEDLVIEKDATRKLSEVYATVGDYTKALKSYQDYVALVDKSYTKKQQEIQQIKRFSKRIAENQNRISSLEKDKELSDSRIILANKDKQLTQESNKRQQIIIYTLVICILLLSLAAFLLYKFSEKQKQANNLLALKSMRSQMNPHFIFNALNSVNSFIAISDERSANRYLSEFSALMRSVLENSDEDFIPLAKEIELLQLYVKLEHNRFKDKFEYTIVVDEKIQLEEYAIPPMLLQPYIENAIWHGLRYKKEMGKLVVAIVQKTKDSIEICIEDDGVGRQKSMEMKTKNQLKQKSKGMSTIKNRIAILNDMYQDKIKVSISNALANGTGTKVVVTLQKK